MASPAKASTSSRSKRSLPGRELRAGVARDHLHRAAGVGQVAKVRAREGHHRGVDLEEHPAVPGREVRRSGADAHADHPERTRSLGRAQGGHRVAQAPRAVVVAQRLRVAEALTSVSGGPRDELARGALGRVALEHVVEPVGAAGDGEARHAVVAPRAQHHADQHEQRQRGTRASTSPRGAVRSHCTSRVPTHHPHHQDHAHERERELPEAGEPPRREQRDEGAAERAAHGHGEVVRAQRAGVGAGVVELAVGREGHRGEGAEVQNRLQRRGAGVAAEAQPHARGGDLRREHAQGRGHAARPLKATTKVPR